MLHFYTEWLLSVRYLVEKTLAIATMPVRPKTFWFRKCGWSKNCVCPTWSNEDVQRIFTQFNYLKLSLTWLGIKNVKLLLDALFGPQYLSFSRHHKSPSNTIWIIDEFKGAFIGL
jgi:hypothetical protein